MSLMNMDFIIPVKIDGKDRLENLSLILKYLKYHFPENKIIIVEQGDVPRCCFLDGYNQYVYFKTDKMCYIEKCRLLNTGILLSKSKVVCVQDTDCLIPRLCYIRSYDMIKNGDCDAIIPYDGRHMSCKREFYNKIQETMSCDFFDYEKDLHQITNTSVGGINLYNREVLLELGMYNENFSAWGEEDIEIIERFRKLGKKFINLPGNNYLVHIYHGYTGESFHGFGNPKYGDNLMEKDKIVDFDKYELLDYMKTWNWITQECHNFIDKNRRYRIGFVSSWEGMDEETNCNLANKCTLNFDYKYKDLELCYDGDYDFVVTHNKVDNLKYSNYRTIVFQSEPFELRKMFYGENNEEKINNSFFKFFSMNKYHFMDFHWSNIKRNYSELIKEVNIKNKSKNIVSFISNKFDQKLIGYKYRLDFLKYLDSISGFENYCPICNSFCKEYLLGLKCYRSPVKYIDDVMLESKYVVQMENSYDDEYFSERLFVSLFCECLPFYAGSKKIDYFVDPDCFIRIDLTKPLEALDIVKQAIKNNEFKNRIKLIRSEKKRLLIDMNPLEIIHRIINGYYDD